MSRLTKVLAAVVMTGALIVGGSFAAWYFLWRSEAEPRAELRQTRCTHGGTVDGTYQVHPGDPDSFVGYRVQERFAVVENTATGRTNDIRGSFTIQGTVVRGADFTADLRTLTSDRAGRDRAIRTRGLESKQFPKAKFRLTEPIDLSTATTRHAVEAMATGAFTLHGVTRRVQIPLEACRDKADADRVQVVGHLPIEFADYGIEAPSVVGFVSVQDHGEIEFQLYVTRR